LPIVKPGLWRRCRAAFIFAGKQDMVEWRLPPKLEMTEGSLLLLQKTEKLQSKRRGFRRIGKNNREYKTFVFLISVKIFYFLGVQISQNLVFSHVFDLRDIFFTGKKPGEADFVPASSFPHISGAAPLSGIRAHLDPPAAAK
jgi:hypothetical protein